MSNNKLPPKSAAEAQIETQIKQFQETWKDNTPQERENILLSLVIKLLMKQQILEDVVSTIPFVQEQQKEFVEKLKKAQDISNNETPGKNV